MIPDMSSDLATLAANITADSTSSAYKLRQLAAAGTDVGIIRELLMPWMAMGSRPHGALLGAALGFSDAHARRWSRLDQLVSHECEHARWGAIRALAELGAAGEQSPELFDFLGRGAADTAHEVRKTALEGANNTLKQGRLPRPTSRGLRQLALLLDDSEQLAEFVHLIAIRDIEAAATVRTTLEALTSRTQGQENMLRECRSIAAGLIEPPCRLCSSLDDFECAGHEEDLPPAAHKLVEHSGSIRVCPTCGARYSYGWSELYDDEFGSHGTYDVKRLPPEPGTRSRAQLLADLDRPSQHDQRQAARTLTREFLDEHAREPLRRLLQHKATAVRTHAWITLRMALPEADDRDALIALCHDALDDTLEDVQHAAAQLASGHHIHHQAYEALQKLLAHRRRMVQWGATWALRRAVEHTDFPLAPLRSAIEQNTLSRDILVRQSAIAALKLALRQKRSMPALLPTLLAMLDSDSPEVRDEALSELGTLVFLEKHQMRGFVPLDRPALVALLDRMIAADRSVFKATSVRKELLEPGNL